MTHRFARGACCLLLLVPGLVVPVVAAPVAPPAGTPADIAQVHAAIDGIDAEIAALARAHPDLIGNAPEQRWRSYYETQPWAALRDAAAELARVRVHVILEMPAESEYSRLAPPDVQTVLRVSYASVRANATRLVEQFQDARMPAPGVLLEDQLLRHLPAFAVLARPESVDLYLAAFPYYGNKTSVVMDEMAFIESQRVRWDYLVPTAPSMAASQPALSLLQAAYIRQNATHTGSPSAVVSEALQLSVRHFGQGHVFAAVAFAVVAERETGRELATAGYMVNGAPVRPLVEAEFARMAAQPESALVLDAQQAAYGLLVQIPDGPASLAPGTMALLSMVMGDYAAIRLLRGLPELEVVAPASSSQTSGAPAIPVVALVAALAASALIAAARRRR